LVGGYVAGSSQCDRTTARWLRGRARLSTVSALQWQQTSHESDSESAAESARVREQLVVRCIPFHVLSSHRHLRCGYHDHHHHHHHCLRSSCCCCSIDGRGLGHCVGRETSCQRSPCRSCAAPSTTSFPPLTLALLLGAFQCLTGDAVKKRVLAVHCRLGFGVLMWHLNSNSNKHREAAEYTRRGGVGRRQTDIPLRRSFPCRIARWNSQNQNPRVAAWAQRQHRR